MIYSLLDNWQDTKIKDLEKEVEELRSNNMVLTRKVERLTDALSCLESMLYLVCLLSHVCMFVCLFVCLNVCMFVCLFTYIPGTSVGKQTN